LESKGVKSMLIAILVALILLLIPSWGMFLTGMHGENGGAVHAAASAGTVAPSISAVTSTLSANNETPVSSMTAEPTEKPYGKATVLGEPDAEGWVKVSLPFFNEPVMAKPTLKEPNIAYITVKVIEGMEITTPGRCFYNKNGSIEKIHGYVFSKKQEYIKGDRRILLSFDVKFQCIAESGIQDGGYVLGAFKADGEATIMTESLKPQKIAQTDIAAWCDTMLEMVLVE